MVTVGLYAGLYLVLSLVLGGCAHPFWHHARGDPLEPVNRTVFAFNKVADKVVIGPAAKAYRTVTPKPVRKGVRHFLNNLQSPLILANDLLQGKLKRAAETTFRFAINSTVGLGGVLDVASKTGVKRHTEDLGQTLAHHGVAPGPYLVVPILGPRNMRDLAGLAVEQVLSPTSAVRFEGRETFGRARQALNTVEERTDSHRKTRVIRHAGGDEYAAVRKLYRQKRLALIADLEADREAAASFEAMGTNTGAEPPQSPETAAPVRQIP